MIDLETLVASLESKLDGDFKERMARELKKKDRRWLERELLNHVLRERHIHSTAHRQLGRQEDHVESVPDRKKRLARIQKAGIDARSLRARIKFYKSLSRETLVKKEYMVSPPLKGKEAIGDRHRTRKGKALIQEAHDLFYALLFCDENLGVDLIRSRRDFLTVTLPCKKAESLERFMLAVTQTHVAGTWLDPDGVSDDIEAKNEILQVEYGDTKDELVSDALIAVLGLINNLEVNEQILYARIEKIARSTLIQ